MRPPPALYGDDGAGAWLDVGDERIAGPVAGALDLGDVPRPTGLGPGEPLERGHPQRRARDTEGGRGPLRRARTGLRDRHRIGGTDSRGRSGHEQDAQAGGGECQARTWHRAAWYLRLHERAVPLAGRAVA